MEQTQKSKKSASIACLLTFLFLCGSAFLCRWALLYATITLVISSSITLFFSFLVWNTYRLKYNAEVEAEEQKKIIQENNASKELFEESDEALMLAARSYRTWSSYILPAITIIAGLVGVYAFFTLWTKSIVSLKTDPKTQMAASACAAVLGITYFLLGAYYNGAAKRKGGLGLRPISAWAYFSAIVSVASMVVLFFNGEKYPDLDKIISRIVLIVMIILSFELSINFIIDLYRPRHHIEEKSILESRLLTIFTDSGSIASNISHALDYQFGIKISEKSFYSFITRVLLPLLVIQVLALYLLSCFTMVDIGHRGLKEFCGKVDSTKELTPGLYIHLPYPLTKIHVFAADKISVVEIGQLSKPLEKSIMPESEEEAMAGDTNIVTTTPNIELWTKKGHHQGMEEINYVVSTNRPKTLGGDSTQDVNMITAIVPVHYRIKEFKEGEISPLYQYLYNHSNPTKMIETISSEVLMNYLSSSNYFLFLGSDRDKAAKQLQTEIQASLDENQLGVEIVLIALESIHPPREVSSSYDDVMSAEFDRDNSTLSAKVDKIKIISEATIKEKNIIAQAQGETAIIDYTSSTGEKMQIPMKLALAKEKGARLIIQNESYKSQPYLFSLINYLEVLENGLTNSKMVLIDDAKRSYNFKFDLKPKLVPDFEGLQIPKAQ